MSEVVKSWLILIKDDSIIMLTSCFVEIKT